MFCLLGLWHTVFALSNNTLRERVSSRAFLLLDCVNQPASHNSPALSPAGSIDAAQVGSALRALGKTPSEEEIKVARRVATFFADASCFGTGAQC